MLNRHRSRRFGLLIILLPAFLWAQPTAGPVANGVLQLEPVKVNGSNLSASDTMGTEPTEIYHAQDVEESGAFDLAEFFSQLPESPAGTEQLVLIDGEPTYLDISKLPPEMIASIEVSNEGALPQYGAYANGRVINIRLKTSYHGENLSLSMRGSFQGDGLQTLASFSGAVSRDKTRFIYGVGYRKQQALFASDRSFSREQNHTAMGGRDLRLLWGDAAVVQAVSGSLSGVVDANGQPTSVALAPENQDGRGLTAADFLPARIFSPATEATAAGQRRFNTADDVTLIAPSEERSATFEFGRPLSKRLHLSISGSATGRDSTRSLAPPVTPVSSDTVVPAAYNPFGQDVQVGLVHAGFGPVRQRNESTAAQLAVILSGGWAETWRWNATLGEKWSQSDQEVTDLDRDAFAAALASPDPAQRFNPFGDDPLNASLYRDLAIVRASETESSSTRLDLSTHGELRTLPGGPLRMVLRGNVSNQRRTKTYRNPASPVATEPFRRDNDQRVTASFILPWIGQSNARAWARRLETSFVTGYSSRSGSKGGSVNGRFALTWSPLRAFSMRGNYAVTRLAPSRFLADAQPLAGETFIDPRRSPATATDVQVNEHDFDGALRARADQLIVSATVKPPILAGLQMSVTYDRRQKQDLTSDAFKAQDLIYNELTFPGRVVRASPTGDDLLLGQPGRIVSVDTTPSDRATQEASGLSWSLRYRQISERFGQISLVGSVRQSLSNRYEVAPGVPFVFESANDLNPPDWNLHSRLSWSRRGWRLSTDFRYVDEVQSGTLIQPATNRLSLQFGYRFAKAVWGRWGRGLQVSLKLDDVLEDEPPFADTINGYRTGSPLGRTWSLMMKLPLMSSSNGKTGDSESDDN